MKFIINKIAFSKYFFICFFFSIFHSAHSLKAQRVYNIETLPAHPLGSSFRGLQAVSDQIIWVSGSKGIVGLSTDGGSHWRWQQVVGYEKRDFRDIVAFDSVTALIMAIAEPAVILRTDNGGLTWLPVFTDSTPGMFLDAMHFIDANNGLVVGDPIGKSAFLANTNDGGRSWQSFHLLQANITPIPLDSGEAFFASSGSNVQLMHPGKANNGWMVTGGNRSRLMNTDGQASFDLPFYPGGTSRGANSIAMRDAFRGIIVGGDFSNDTAKANNCVIVDLHQVGTKVEEIFSRPVTPPAGYRSCVAHIKGNQWITCGTSGIDITLDGGINWQPISTIGYHTLSISPKGKYAYLAGGGGRLARIRIK
jgi:hypothetical protein